MSLSEISFKVGARINLFNMQNVWEYVRIAKIFF